MIQLDLHPSRYLLMLLLLIHAAALLLIFTLSIQWWAILAIALILVINFIFVARRYVTRRLRQSVVKVWVNGNDEWHVLLRDNKTHRVKLLRSTYCSQFIIILNFQLSLEGKTKTLSVIVMPDSVHATVFRRLRSYLLHQAKV